MSKAEVVVFDLDGVVFEVQPIIDAVQKKYPSFQLKDLIRYEVGESLLRANHISAKETENFDRIFWTTEGAEIFTNAIVYEDTVSFIKFLTNRGYIIHFVSARDVTEDNIRITSEKLTAVGLGDYEVHLLGSYDKLQKCMELDAKILVEDRAETLQHCVGKHGIPWGILRDQPYNRHYLLNDNIARVSDFSQGEIQSLIEKYHLLEAVLPRIGE